MQTSADTVPSAAAVMVVRRSDHWARIPPSSAPNEPTPQLTTRTTAAARPRSSCLSLENHREVYSLAAIKCHHMYRSVYPKLTRHTRLGAFEVSCLLLGPRRGCSPRSAKRSLRQSTFQQDDQCGCSHHKQSQEQPQSPRVGRQQ